MKWFLSISFLLFTTSIYSQKDTIIVLAANNSCLSCYQNISDYLFYECNKNPYIQYIIIDTTTLEQNRILISKLYLPDTIKNKIIIRPSYQFLTNSFSPADLYPQIIIIGKHCSIKFNYSDLFRGRFLKSEIIDNCLD